MAGTDKPLERGYVWVAGRQIHYRTAGHGPPVVMLHPSPLSSAAVLPMARTLAEHFTVVALDTPGYGQSDPLPEAGRDLRDYAHFLALTLDALGLERVCLYGAATGAQLAVAFALQYPQRAAQVVMDAAGHVDEEECDRILEDYFPAIAPASDGSHLPRIWQASRDLAVFFPWSERRRATRLSVDVPQPAVVQQTVQGYLDAGSDYARAYRAAFLHERAAPVQALTVPTVVTRWENSIVLGMTDALLAHELPANVAALPLAGGMPARLAGVSTFLREHYRGAPASLATPPAPTNGLARGFTGTAGRQLHGYRRPGRGRPLLLVHDCDGSAAVLADVAGNWPAGRPLQVVDLPGHGVSDALLPVELAAPADYATCLLEQLDILQGSGVDVLGVGGGAAVAAELVHQRPAAFATLGIVQPLLLTAAERDEFRTHFTPDVQPRWDGSHLVTAWQMLRDQALFWPWFQRTASAIREQEPGPELDPAYLQRRLVALMQCAARYRQAFAGALDYPLLDRLAAVDQPVLRAGLRAHPLSARLQGPMVQLTPARRDWGMLLETALAAARE
jgi:pimeloyl-ACP methyl ester carboxylesterase